MQKERYAKSFNKEECLDLIIQSELVATHNGVNIRHGCCDAHGHYTLLDGLSDTVTILAEKE